MRPHHTWLSADKVLRKEAHYLCIPRISATQSTGMLPRNPRECCHPVQRISAIDSTGMLPSSLRHGCHPRSVAPLARMVNLGSLLFSVAGGLAVVSLARFRPAIGV